MSSEEVEDFNSIAQEWGGRIGFLYKEEYEDHLMPVIVRSSVTDGAISYEIIIPDQEKMILVLTSDDHEWILNNPVPGEEDNDATED